MTEHTQVVILPEEIQKLFRARLIRATPTELGAFRLVGIRMTKPSDFESNRISVLVLNEDGVAFPQVPVAFAYDTADFFTIDESFQWELPLGEQRAFIVPTGGGGQTDLVLGAEGVVKQGQAGGVTVFIIDPKFSSDAVSGCGMLADHTGMHLTFQLFPTGHISNAEQLAEVRQWIFTFAKQLTLLEDKVSALESQITFINNAIGEK